MKFFKRKLNKYRSLLNKDGEIGVGRYDYLLGISKLESGSIRELLSPEFEQLKPRSDDLIKQLINELLEQDNFNN